jgi:hypothetical protein
MRHIRNTLLAGVALAAASLTPIGLPIGHAAASSSTTAPFNQCQPVGLDTSCFLLIVVNPGGGVTVLQDNAQSPTYDGVEDTLIGVQNNSGGPISSLSLTATTDAFGFDGDGICTQTPSPAGCPFGPTGYEGPNTSFSGISSDLKSGTVNFTATGGLASGGSTFFGLEEALTAGSIAPSCAPSFTPTTTVKGSTPGNLTVTGKTVIDGATIGGNVLVKPGADVFIRKSTIGGTLNSDSANSVAVSGSTVRGETALTRTRQATNLGQVKGCLANQFAALSVSYSPGAIDVSHNKLSGWMVANNNTGGVGIEANSIAGNLTCYSNAPAPSDNGQPNSVGGRRYGQCSSPSNF